MKLAAPEEYGLRCLLQLASEPSGFLTIQQIADRESLTPAYVTKLMGQLRSNGFVNSVRGQKGGYRLAAPPAELNVGVILAALGGRLYSPEYSFDHKTRHEDCVHRVDCSVRALWAALDAAVQGVLQDATLEHLMCGEKKAASWLRSRLREQGLRARPRRS